MIFKKINNDWQECPKALADKDQYERVDPIQNEIKSDANGYVGDVELMYATHSEVFDAISPASLKEKTYQFILLKAQEKALKDKISLLNDEIKHLHFAVESNGNQVDTLKGGNAGEISFQETKKVVYTPEAVEMIKSLINKQGGNVSKDGKQIIEDKINEKQLQAFEKANPELAKQIEALKKYKTEIKTVVKPNKDFMLGQEDPNEIFKDDRQLAASERYKIFRNVYENAVAYESKTLKLNEAQMFASQMEILKSEFDNIKKEEIIKSMFKEPSKEEPEVSDSNEMEMN